MTNLTMFDVKQIIIAKNETLSDRDCVKKILIVSEDSTFELSLHNKGTLITTTPRDYLDARIKAKAKIRAGVKQ